jgi:E3 ubiquitin-protein ligase DMA1/2
MLAKYHPSFTCPNCRAVADLEADVDVPEDSTEMWDEEEEVEEHVDNHSTDQNCDTEMPDGVQEDAPSRTTSTAGSTLARSEEPGQVPAEDRPRSPSNSEDAEQNDTDGVRLNATAANLISRRQASNVSLPRAGTGAVTAIDMPAPSTPANAQHTSASNMEDRLVSTPRSTEQITNDGLLTPTNNAGPFVFDGSAGRSTGRRLTATVENIEDPTI